MASVVLMCWPPDAIPLPGPRMVTVLGVFEFYLLYYAAVESCDVAVGTLAVSLLDVEKGISGVARSISWRLLDFVPGVGGLCAVPGAASQKLVALPFLLPLKAAAAPEKRSRVNGSCWKAEDELVELCLAALPPEYCQFVMLAGAYCPNPLDAAGMLSIGRSVCWCAQLLAGNQVAMDCRQNRVVLVLLLRDYDEVVMLDAECGSGADNQDAGILISAGCSAPISPGLHFSEDSTTRLCGRGSEASAAGVVSVP
ncbi:hypothetical protein Nepgr_023182 [Nepenthes gracilis]|uniref:Uncharacterized protein n=1 Tax=Nepenthes gracilis TaxID=150966 RepID=A0AAD3T1Z7_NEPGR|nr:hypothetical protein Nepgr_023182 [Nepenthes gracilis]